MTLREFVRVEKGVGEQKKHDRKRTKLAAEFAKPVAANTKLAGGLQNLRDAKGSRRETCGNNGATEKNKIKMTVNTHTATAAQVQSAFPRTQSTAKHADTSQEGWGG